MFSSTTNFSQQQASSPLKKFTFGAFSWNGEYLNSPQYLFGNHTAEAGPISNSIEYYLGFNRKMAKMVFQQKDEWITPLNYQYITGSNFSALAGLVGPQEKFNELQLINYESDPEVARLYEIREQNHGTYLINADRIKKFDWPNFFSGYYHNIWEVKADDQTLYDTTLNWKTTQISERQMSQEGLVITNKQPDSQGNFPTGVIAYGPTGKYGTPPDEYNDTSNGYTQDVRFRINAKRGEEGPELNYIAKFSITSEANANVPDTNNVVKIELKIVGYNYTIPKHSVIIDTVQIFNLSQLQSGEVQFQYKLKYNDNTWASNGNYASSFFVISALDPNVQIKFRKMEIFDNEIYNTREMWRSTAIVTAEERVHKYLDDVYSAESRFKDIKIDFFGIDEPHSPDLWEAIGFANSLVRDYQGGIDPKNKPSLIGTFITRYNSTIGHYGAMSNGFYEYYRKTRPDIFMPYTYWQSNYFDFVSDIWYKIKNLSYIRKTIDHFNPEQKWFYDINVWDDLNNVNAGATWRAPSEDELGRLIMATLSFGANGIQLCPIFSYPKFEPRTKGLVTWYGAFSGTGSGTFGEFRIEPLGMYIKDIIAPRLNGALGFTLANYTKYVNLEAVLDQNLPNINTLPHYKYNENRILKLDGTNRSKPDYIIAGIFSSTVKSNDWYFLISNMGIRDEYSSDVKATVSRQSFFTNYYLIDIEKRYGKRTLTFNGPSDSLILPVPYADGVLWRLTPAIEAGGSFDGIETIPAGHIAVIEDSALTVTNGTITVDGKLTANKEIILNSGTSLFLRPGSELVLNNCNLVLESGSYLGPDLANPKTGVNPKFIITGSGRIINKTNLNLTNYEFIYQGIAPETQVGIVTADTGSTTVLHQVTFTNCPIAVGGTGNATMFLDSCTVSGGNIALYGQGVTSKIRLTNSTINTTTGIDITLCEDVVISNNTITTAAGLGLSAVLTTNLLIKGNTFSDITPQGSYCGILLMNSQGYIRSNLIKNYTTGIQLLESSPFIFNNRIETNTERGIYIGSGSNPVMYPQPGYSQSNDPVEFGSGGYNFIHSNGPADSLGEEILFAAQEKEVLNFGRNTIADLRSATTPLIVGVENPMVNLNDNYFGTSAPESRFIDMGYSYQNILSQPASPLQGAEYQLLTFGTEIIDTFYSVKQITGNFPVELQYFYTAEAKYFNSEFQDAVPYYRALLVNWTNRERSIVCCERLISMYTVLDMHYYTDTLMEFYSYLGSRIPLALSSSEANALTNLQMQLQAYSGEYQGAVQSAGYIAQSNPGTETGAVAEATQAILQQFIPDEQNKNTTGDDEVVLGKAEVTKKKEILKSFLKNRYGMGKEVKTTKLLPTKFEVTQNYPNPFNPVTTIGYALPNRGKVTVDVFNSLGEKISTLADEVKEPGNYTVSFNGSRYASGVYFYRVNFNGNIITKRMMMVK